MSILFLIIYLIFSVLVAFFARNAAIGFWGVLAMSIFLTPLLTAILIVILKPKSTPKKKKLEDLKYLEEN